MNICSPSRKIRGRFRYRSLNYWKWPPWGPRCYICVQIDDLWVRSWCVLLSFPTLCDPSYHLPRLERFFTSSPFSCDLGDVGTFFSIVRSTRAVPLGILFPSPHCRHAEYPSFERLRPTTHCGLVFPLQCRFFVGFSPFRKSPPWLRRSGIVLC